MRQLSVVMLISLLAAVPGPLAETAPFDLDSGRPMVQLTVNGKGPFPFVLDTGMPGLMVLRSLADELRLEVTGQTQIQSPAKGKPIDTQLVRVDSVAMGGVVVRDLEATVLDMEGVGLGKGVVGPVVFREHGPITLDFKRNTVALGKDATASVETWLPFGDSAPLLDAPVRIGQVVIAGHIDTGNPGVLTVPNGMEERLTLAGPVRTVGRAQTVDAEFEIRGAPIEDSARIGDAEIPLQQITLSDLPWANLGTGGLRGLVLHVDWDKQRFGLTGTAEPTESGVRRRVRQAPAGDGPRRIVRSAPAGDGPRFGMRAMPSPDGTIRIAGIDPGSAAEAMGLEAGDKIVAVNGKPPGELEFSQMRAELARTDLELKVERDGKTIALER